jgi:hypothetical protein
MKILMTASAPGSVDGIRVKQYVEGAEYDLTTTPGERDLAAAFVGAGLAVEVSDDPPQAPEDPAAPPEAKRPGRKPKQ